MKGESNQNYPIQLKSLSLTLDNQSNASAFVRFHGYLNMYKWSIRQSDVIAARDTETKE